MSFQFKLLITNPILHSNDYFQLNSSYLDHCLQLPLRLPQMMPFIFSCFVLSVDGKLAYPDLASGFALAKCNYQASSDERVADWWCLNLARAISDAVIIGSNSLLWENEHNFSAEITVPELAALRQQLGKTPNLLHIVICRDLQKLDLNRERISLDPELAVVIFCQQPPAQLPANFKITSLAELNLNQTKQIIVDAKLELTHLINRLAELGIQTILNESPYYHHYLQEKQLLDEAWLNSSGVYIGGAITALGHKQTSFTSHNHPHYSLLSLHHLGYNFLYSRYQISYS